MEKELQDKDEVIKIKDGVVLAKDQELQSLQHEFEAREFLLKRLNQQLESSQNIPTLQQTITQYFRV